MHYFAALSVCHRPHLLLHMWLPTWRLTWLLCLLACCLLQIDAKAAEVGNIRVLSHIGQPLRAEIELAAVAPDEGPSLQVKLALPDVYRLANIRRNPVLNNVRLQLQQQAGRYIVAVQSNQAVQESYLNMYLEFSDAKGHEVRALTLWLEADPEHPVAEVASNTRDIPHPDGDLSETAAIPPSPFADKTETSAKPSVVHNKAVPTAISEAELAGHAAPPRHLPKNAPQLAPHLPLESTSHGSCGTNVRKLQQEINHCKLVEAENIKIASQIDVLEDKVGILKRVILTEDKAAPMAPPIAVAAPIAEVAKKKAPPQVFPWKILLTSAAVFVSVAVLAFALLTLRSKRLAKKKAAKNKTIAAKTEAAPTENAAPAEAAEGASESSKPASGKDGKETKAKAGSKALASIKARWQSMAEKFRKLGHIGNPLAKFKGLFSRLKFPKKKAKAEVHEEPTAEKGAEKAPA